MRCCHCGHIEDDHQEDYGCYECEASAPRGLALDGEHVAAAASAQLDWRHEYDPDIEGLEEPYHDGGDDPLYRAAMRDAGRGELLR